MDAAHYAYEQAPAPDPRAVESAADLAEQLRRLRMSAGRPSPIDNPLTLRELAVLTGLPHSTLGNAESGRVLPRVEVVYRIAQACGVPVEQLPWWTAARNRVAMGRRRPSPHAVAAPLPRENHGLSGSVVADEHNSQADALLVELGGVGFEKAAGWLATQPAESVTAFLRRLHPALRANLLAVMDPVLATGHLAALPPSDIVACLNHMDSGAAARLLTLAPATDAVTHLAQIRPQAAVDALVAMPATALADRLSHLDDEVMRQTVRRLPLARRTALLTAAPLPEALCSELLFSLGFDDLAALLTTLTPGVAARLLVALPPDPAAGLLAHLPASEAARLLKRLPCDHAAARLAAMTDQQAAGRLSRLPTRAAGEALSQMPAPCAARILAWVSDARRTAMLRQTRADRVVAIRWYTETPDYRIWLRDRMAEPVRDGIGGSAALAELPTLSDRPLSFPRAAA
ncbi:magnesium transporter MgtE N-terminal domain-containing protein [Actinoplanes sp. CA-131856]